MERAVTITYLEMTDRSDVVPFTAARRLEVRRAEEPSPELSRFLYTTVGAEWWWYERLAWDRARWLAHLQRPELETWIGYLSGTPAGYFELVAEPAGQVELAFFGLLPSFIGRGLGAELLAWAVDRAWELADERVWLHTCTLDHPRALPNYQALGFRIFERIETIAELPDGRATLWPED